MAHDSNPHDTPTALRKGQDRTQALIAAMVPADVRKRIDDEELGDRLAAAARLLERARGASGVVANGYGEMARDLLKAQPRSVTATQVRDLMLKSARAGTAAEQEDWRAKAERLKSAHPMAPRRRPPAGTVAKAKTVDLTGMIACYDATGALIGIAPKDKIQPVVPYGQETDAIEKARAARKRGQR